MNEFIITLQAMLDSEKSKGNINANISKLQEQLNKLKLQAELDPKTLFNIKRQIEKATNQNISISGINLNEAQIEKTGQNIGTNINKELMSGLRDVKNNIYNTIKEFDNNKLTFTNLSKIFNLNRSDIDSSVLEQVKSLTKEINSLSKEVIKTGSDNSWESVINKVNSLYSVLSQFGKTRDLMPFKESLDILKQFEGKKIFVNNKSEVLQNTGMNVRQLNNQLRSLNVTLTTSKKNAIDLDTVWNELCNISPNLEKFISFGDQFNAVIQLLLQSKQGLYGKDNLQPLQGNEVSKVLLGYMNNLEETSKKVALLRGQEEELKQGSNSTTAAIVQNEQQKQHTMQETVKIQRKVADEQAKAEKSTHSLFASFKKNFSFLSYWTSANYIFMTTIRKIKEMVSNVRELEAALININYTMEELSGRQLKEIGESSLQMAKDLNTSASNILSSVKLYANAKESAESILQKAQPAIMLSNVTGMTGEKSAKMLQSIMNQFDMKQNDLMEIADTIEMVSQNMSYDFASGIDEIANGIEQSGSVAKSAGLNLQEYVSMLGLVIEKTGQSGSTIGNAYKTIFQRITKASATEGTLEEDISAAEKSLRAVGIEVRDTSDEFRDLTDIMSDLGEVWDSLSSVQQSNISYNVAGVRQTNILKSLLGYWEDYENLVEKANNASGTTLKNQEIYAESLQGKLGELSATWSNISNDTISSSFLKGLADAGIGVSSLIEKIGLLKSVIASVGIAAFVKNFA